MFGLGQPGILILTGRLMDGVLELVHSPTTEYSRGDWVAFARMPRTFLTRNTFPRVHCWYLGVSSNRGTPENGWFSLWFPFEATRKGYPEMGHPKMGGLPLVSPQKHKPICILGNHQCEGAPSDALKLAWLWANAWPVYAVRAWVYLDFILIPQSP